MKPGDLVETIDCGGRYSNEPPRIGLIAGPTSLDPVLDFPNLPVTWPPKPGELWIAEDEWPTYGLSDQAGFINSGDVFLVVEAGPVVGEELSPGSIGLKDFKSCRSVHLQVIVHGVKRLMISACVDGKLDMHPLEQTHESSTI